MFRSLLVTAVSVALIIIGVTLYLGPNDLAWCGSTPSTKTGCETADAIVAISGGDTTARTNEAIKLYKEGWAPLLIFSGAAADKTGPSNALTMERMALAEGVPQSNILLDQSSVNTAENATDTNQIFMSHGIQSIILVTSSYHQRRASIEFKRLAPTVSLRNHPVATDDQWSPWWWLTPEGWYLAVSELIKIIAFYVAGAN